MAEGVQNPTNGKQAQTYSEMLSIAEHPAFRIGFLDGQRGADFDHENIMARIEAETPATALQRIGWGWSAKQEDNPRLPLFMNERMANNRAKAVEVAQYRYEEGRKLAVEFGLRCKGWGHPDYPPKAVIDFIVARASEKNAA